MRAIFCLFSILLLVVLHLTATAHAAEPGPQEPAGKGVAATVNGVPIPEKLLVAEVKQQLEKYARYGMRQATPELTATLRQQALDRLIDQELLRQASSRMVVKDAEEQARRKLAAMQAGFPSPEQFDQYLASRSLSRSKLIDTYRSQLQMDAYLASLGMTDVQPTEEQIAAYYEVARENFKREESIKARHILIVAPPDASQDVKEQARRQAEELLGQLVQDIHQFPRLAASFSGCARSKNQGGDLGYIKRGFMPPEFDAEAFTLSPGEISGIVASKYGYHIIQVDDKRPAGYAPLAEMHDFISKYLQGDMMAKKKASHVAELRKQAVIKVLLN